MIIFEQVTKQFGEDTFALQDVSFDISEGELVVVTGHSGSGKTTLMKLLTKEYLPTQGEILFNNRPLSAIPASQLPHHRRQLGIIFQDYKLLPELNVWENIALALNILGKDQSEIEMRVSDLLRLVDLVDKAFLFPSQLSGGEAQRVSIARALATGPMVIFADEPTGNLDPETSVGIATLLEKINDLGTTVIIATHDLSVMDALTKERHLQLEKGKLVKDTKDTTHTHHSPKTSAQHQSPPATRPSEQKSKAADKSDSAAPVASDSAPKSTKDTKQVDQPAEDKKIETKKPKMKLSLPKFSLPFGRKKAAAKVEKKSEPKSPPDHKSEATMKSDSPNPAKPEKPEKVEVSVESLD